MKIKLWETKQLDEVATFSSGGTPSKEESNYWEGDYPWVSAKDMKSFSIKDAGLKLTPEGLAMAKIAKKGSVLVLVRGMTLLKDLPVGYVERDVAFNQDIKALVAKSGVSGLFLAYALIANKNRILNLVNVAGHGTGRLDTTLLKEFPIDLPPLLEQCRIAEMLGVWDESIDLLEKLIGRVRSRKQGLMQQLLTGKKRFKEFEGSDNRQKTLYGSLPSDWKYIPIADIAQEYSTKNKQANDLTVLSCSKYKGLVNSLEYFGKQVFSEDTSTYKIVKYGMFAYATNHIDEGSIGYQNLCDKALISPMYTVFKTDSNRVHDLFLYSVLKTEYYRQIFSINTSASVERRGSLRWKDFSKIKVPLPSIAEQEKIAAVLSAADEEISTLEKQLAAYKQQKLGLMQQLLTGRIRI
ncbi:restriction endonuclease subunit S [Chamaesiphon sp. VAR_69_metabat_338]|uniref:restriction endonuclease subunit S n=1 Tax=Chamaesiphon sp. VAR_69_metabat_338 TaxID=2964704 RepID=UPI00286EA623|nr:restriction endonuclease subunit S [Chamaesiphon sp. VAR_69_metabat_338]